MQISLQDYSLDFYKVSLLSQEVSNWDLLWFLVYNVILDIIHLFAGFTEKARYLPFSGMCDF